MSRKTKTSNTHAFMTPPSTQATTNLQSMVNEGVDFSTPIRNSYARAGVEHDRTYKNPLGAYTTADVRDKSSRAWHSENAQNMGLDLSNAAQQSAGDKFNRQATVAGLTNPNLVQTGSTVTEPFNWMSLATGAMGAGAGLAASNWGGGQSSAGSASAGRPGASLA